MNKAEQTSDSERDLDPTLVRDQPALRTSTGRSWLIMGGLFAAASLIPFGFLAFDGDRDSAQVALISGMLVIGFYLLIVIARIALPQGRRRLRVMAAAMLTMALCALIGIVLCAFIEGAVFRA